MSNVAVRRARPADAPAIARVQAAVYHETYEGIVPRAALERYTQAAQTDAWRDWIGRNRASVLLVAESAEAGVVGYAGANPLPGGAYNAELSAIYVLAAWRGQGIGRALMRGAVRRLLRLGCRSLMLWVMAENRVALAVYQRWGGHVTAERMWAGGAAYGAEVVEMAVVWPDLAGLRAALEQARANFVVSPNR